MKKNFDDSVNERLLRMDIGKMTDKEFKTFEEEYKKKGRYPKKYYFK